MIIMIPTPRLVAMQELMMHTDAINMAALAIASAVIIVTLLLLLPALRKRANHRVYLVQFVCFKPTPEDRCSCSTEEIVRRTEASGKFCKESLDFQWKVLERAAIGDDNYAPPAMLRVPPNLTVAGAWEEAELVMYGAIDRLFGDAHHVRPSDVDYLIVNCSIFGPTPSLSAAIIKRYRMRDDVKSFNLVGMGCSAGLIALDLARRLLSTPTRSVAPRPRPKYALIFTTENITYCAYTGNDRSKLLPNCLFRIGGVAVLLRSGGAAAAVDKYELLNTTRTQYSGEDEAYRCVYLEEDSDGKVGVTLSRHLKTVAGEALKLHLRDFGAHALPLFEKVRYAFSHTLYTLRLVEKLYKPSMRKAFDHFCVHAGGKAVLDAMEANLQLSKWDMEPSRMTLFRFGNTSSSSPWYSFAYIENKGRVAHRGQLIWQLSFGSGFKCNSAIWRSLRPILPKEPSNVWTDFIDNFPVDIPPIRIIRSSSTN